METERRAEGGVSESFDFLFHRGSTWTRTLAHKEGNNFFYSYNLPLLSCVSCLLILGSMFAQFLSVYACASTKLLVFYFRFYFQNADLSADGKFAMLDGHYITTCLVHSLLSSHKFLVLIALNRIMVHYRCILVSISSSYSGSFTSCC